VSRHVLVLQHAPWEGPGLVARALADRAGDVPVVVRGVVDDPDPDLPDPAALAGLVVMGGPMGADDDARHPGLAAERRLLAAAVDAGVPVLGVCLGMQLLARALGATVHAGHGTEIGFAPVEVVGADPVLAPLGTTPTVLHWHGDAVELPAGATLLARTGVTPVQAFRAGSAVGLQFHVELDEALLGDWLASPAADDLPSGGAEGLRRDARVALPALAPAALAGLSVFADAVRDAAARS
jgi:GMP synthase (glutamine-hydrolysing)